MQDQDMVFSPHEDVKHRRGEGPFHMSDEKYII
jgi:hypothetical protein